jgi:hypothetical protein
MCIYYLLFDYRKKELEDERTTSTRNSMQKYVKRSFRKRIIYIPEHV